MTASLPRRPHVTTTERVALSGSQLEVARIRLSDACLHMKAFAESFISGSQVPLDTQAVMLLGHSRHIAEILVQYLGESPGKPPRDKNIEYSK